MLAHLKHILDYVLAIQNKTMLSTYLLIDYDSKSQDFL